MPGHQDGVARPPATPLVLIHGGPGDPHDYLEPLAALAIDRPVVFYDQLGCGRSDRPADAALWQVGHFVEELRCLLRDLGFPRVYLFGHSWGSMLALEYALTKPVGLAGLVLASPPISIPRWLADARRYRAELPAAISGTLDRNEAAGTLDSPEYITATVAYYQRHLCRLSPWPIELQRGAAGAGLAVYHAMWGPNEFYMTGSLRDYDRTDRLAEIAVPTLFACGRFDEAPPETTAYYQSLVPGADLAVFEHSAHLPMLEEPERFVDTIGEWLRAKDQAQEQARVQAQSVTTSGA